jgi:lipid II:glycine glycyltransferase (peptidoglycan interpeptide bridge formation enzyme)
MENKILSDLINKLPKYSFFRQKFSYRIKNWLSFYWNNFEQTTNYTYHLNLDQDEQEIFDGFRSNIRGDIRKAQKNVIVSSDLSLKAFYEVNKKTFARQSLSIPYSESFVKDIDMEMAARDQRKIFFAKDSDENIHSAIYIVWDKDTSYYLWGGGDPAYRSSGATSLLLWEAIKFSKERGLKIFDFEGSMIQPVERFVRSFGAMQVPYFIITKKSRLMKLIFGLLK